MNKKNIILGLSLILSSVATLNLTSCSDDDEDDANHAPKSAVVDNNQQNTQVEQKRAMVRAGEKTQDSIKTQLGLDVKTFLVNKLSLDEVSHISVQEISDKLYIHIVYTGTSAQNKLRAFDSKQSELTAFIQQYNPNARKFGVKGDNGPANTTSYYCFIYKLPANK